MQTCEVIRLFGELLPYHVEFDASCPTTTLSIILARIELSSRQVYTRYNKKDTGSSFTRVTSHYIFEDGKQVNSSTFKNQRPFFMHSDVMGEDLLCSM